MWLQNLCRTYKNLAGLNRQAYQAQLSPKPYVHADQTVTEASNIAACLQNFFRSYKKLAGMTGTAATEAPEFSNIYKLPVTVVPTNQAVKRTDESDVVFRTEEGMPLLFPQDFLHH